MKWNTLTNKMPLKCLAETLFHPIYTWWIKKTFFTEYFVSLRYHITKIKWVASDISFKIIDFQYSTILKLEKWHAVLLKRTYKSLRSEKSLSKCEYKQIPEEHQCFLLTLCLAHINNLSPASMNVSGNLTALLRNEWSMIRHDFQCRFSEDTSLKTIAWTNGACRCCTVIYNQQN